MSINKILRNIYFPVSFILLSGCDTVVMSPSGDIAAQQANLLVWATGLMLIIVVLV
jgi:cytochrome o ubiquinol oxidase subunit 2